jgi:thiamine-monophosphate kinase
VKKENLVVRSDARSKDIVATTGLCSSTSSDLKILPEKLTAPPKIRKKLLDAILKPQARLQEGLALARTGAVTASIDSSDGLAWSLHEISRASNVGFLIDALPVAPEAYEFAKMHNLDPLELGFYGGEEYELIVTINSKYWKKVKETIVQQGSDLFKIGRATAEKEILFKKGDEVVKVEARGYEHFQT